MQSFTLNRTANYSKLNEMKAHILAFNRVIELFFVSSRLLHHFLVNYLGNFSFKWKTVLLITNFP